MAKKSSIEHNNYRKRLVEKKAGARAALKKKIMDKSSTFEERLKAVGKLNEMPRNSSKVRVRNRCSITGRSRGYYRKFGMSRIALREFGSAGLLPGVIKASW
ncbi:MAG: 30S ribosomal protein S14 [Holosporales bacterium]|jgi:small subunit ribosomal protein S14|nr:30S ribosomal protein S14 [Holosporales bacterium]